MKKLYLKLGEIVHVNGKRFRVKSFGRHLLQLSIAEDDTIMEHYDNGNKHESK